jgi:hypothetical protein
MPRTGAVCSLYLHTKPSPLHALVKDSWFQHSSGTVYWSVTPHSVPVLKSMLLPGQMDHVPKLNILNPMLPALQLDSID